MFRTLGKKQSKMKKNSVSSVLEEVFVSKGQVILEFTFCMIVILLMIYGVAKVFIWSGGDLVARRIAHDQVLTGAPTPIEEIDPYFYSPVGFNAIWLGY